LDLEDGIHFGGSEDKGKGGGRLEREIKPGREEGKRRTPRFCKQIARAGNALYTVHRL